MKQVRKLSYMHPFIEKATLRICFPFAPWTNTRLPPTHPEMDVEFLYTNECRIVDDSGVTRLFPNSLEPSW